ncbi:MAG: hypothetical protein V3T76_00380 [candidate division NC10 bacterium]
MVKRLVTLIIMGSLVVGPVGIAVASEHDFENKGYYDHPVRVLGYIFHPLGWAADTFIAKPLTTLLCVSPNITGCTSHERSSLGLDAVDVIPEVSDE